MPFSIYLLVSNCTFNLYNEIDIILISECEVWERNTLEKGNYLTDHHIALS